MAKRGQYNQAIQYFEMAMAYASKRKRQGILIEILISFGKVLIEKNQLQQAEEKLLSAAQQGEACGMRMLLVKIYDCLNTLYANQKQYVKAYEILQKYIAWQKSLEEQHRRIACNKFNHTHFKYKAKEFEQLYQDIQNVSEVGKSLLTNLKLTKALEKIYEEVQELVQPDIFIIGLYDSEKKCLNYELVLENGQAKVINPIEVEGRSSLGGYCVKNRESIHIKNTEDDVERLYQGSYIVQTTAFKVPRSIIYHPLMVEDQILGILSVQHYAKNWFSKSDFEGLKKLSDYVSIAIHNAKLFEKVNYLAKYDDLTGIYQRREVIRRAEVFLENKTETNQLCLMMIDIDYFKQINDTYGHLMGDNVLKDIAAYLKQLVGQDGIIGRYGGEEFIIACLNDKDIDVIAYAERLRKSIAAENWQKDLRVTISIGVYILQDKEGIMDGLRYADRALYHAKSCGRNTVCFQTNEEDLDGTD